MSSPSIMDSLFQRTLEDLIKGLRLHLVDSSSFISKSLDEIRREITSTELNTKSTALQKLTYLRSLHGVDDSFAAFHAVELTSSPRFHHKKIGYLAASISFHSATAVALLLTNQLRKDLTSANEHEVTLALECLSSICTPDLARDLTPEIFTLLSSSKLFIRKKAVATVLMFFCEYPNAVRVCFKKLVENLESSDLQTVSAVISVFCELASREPKSYLPLAPEFYRVLVDSRNNWVLIKVLKIFAKLAPLEPRLAKRIVEPICDHMRRSGAKSLVFECIRTVVTSLTDYESAVRLAVAKAKEFLVDDDPNLKYLGLQALSIVAYKYSWAVVENKEFVIKSLSDTDPNIKLEALHLVMAMVCEDNVAEICRVLLNYALKSDPEFCNEILGSVLSTCCVNYYEKIVDFDWYVSVLGDMSRIPNCQKGEEIESQLIDIGMRVKDARPELVCVGRDLLIDPALLGNPFLHRILSAAAWVSGEYVELSNNPIELMEALLQPRTSLLPPSIRAVYIHSALKVLIFCLHSHLSSEEVVTSSSLCANILEPIVVESVTGFPKGSWLPSSEGLVGYEQNEDFKPRFLCQSLEDDSIENDGNTVVAPAPSLPLASLKKEHFTHGSILNLLDIVKTAFGQLARSHEVEVQERVQNVLGLIELVEQGIGDSPMQKEGKFLGATLEASEVIRLLHDAFSDEIGPVSLSAQERVPIPDGLMLNENLEDLETICADIHLPTSSSFSLGKTHFDERSGASLLNWENKEESEPSSESTSLLAEHRKRHGLYYLHSGMKADTSNDYPPANEPELRSYVSDDVDDLVKVTDQSLGPKKKQNQTKPRPVVVRLDGDEVHIAVKKPDSKDDLISGAVRDVLLGNEAIPASSGGKPSKESSSKKGKEKVNIVQPLESTQNLANAGISDVISSSLRRSRHVSHGKERKHRSPRKNVGESEEKSQDEKKKRSHRHGKNKARHRAEGGLDVVAQTSVIPDFLL